MISKDFRRKAREQLSGQYWTVWLVGIIVPLILLAPDIILLTIGGMGAVMAASSVTSLYTLILVGPLAVGLSYFLLNVVRSSEEETEIGLIFNGFKKSFLLSLAASLLVGLFTILWFLLLIIPGIVKIFSYSMTYFIIADNPNIGVTEAITKSRKMMDGNKWKLFKLHFSFIGWYILSAVTIIGWIFLTPYIQVAVANFYEEIKGGNDSTIEPQVEE